MKETIFKTCDQCLDIQDDLTLTTIRKKELKMLVKNITNEKKQLYNKLGEDKVQRPENHEIKPRIAKENINMEHCED